MSTPVIYKAHGTQGTRATYGETPRKAAVAFFDQNPQARQASVSEGRDDSGHFVVRYGRASQNEWPDSWDKVSRKTAATLPDVTRQHGAPSLKEATTTAA